MFFDIEVVFNNVMFESLCQTAREHGDNQVLVDRISCMLRNRILFSRTESDKSTVLGVTKDCPQEGVSSPLLYSMLLELRSPEVHPQAYADDVSVLSIGKSMGTLCRKF